MIKKELTQIAVKQVMYFFLHSLSRSSTGFQQELIPFLILCHVVYAMLSLQNGDDIKTVQQNVGHATASFTLDVYGHVSDRMQKESAKRMQSFCNTLSEAK